MMEKLTPPQFHALIESAPCGLLLFDAGGCVCGYNAALVDCLGEAVRDLMGRPVAAPEWRSLAALTEGETPTVNGPDGEERHLRVTRCPLDGGRGGEAWFVEDITAFHRVREERDRLADELAAQSLNDPLTGLLNRRGLMVALEPQVSRSRRYHNPLSMIVMEVGTDGAREPFLTAVSRMLKDQVRWADLVGCTEDHEFVLALPETRREDAMRLAEKLRAALEGTREGHYTWVAYGVTEWVRSDSAATLLNRACTALDQARASATADVVAL